MNHIAAKTSAWLLAAAIMASAPTAAAAAAIQPQPSQAPASAPDRIESPHGELRHPKGHPGHQRYRKAHKQMMIREAVSFFGLKTEGKSEEQLLQEIREQKTKQPEKWAQFKQQLHAKKLERMKAFAAAQGIDTNGLSEQQLREKLRQLHQEGKLKLPERPSAPTAPAPAPNA
ncbi:hypothetical protein HGI30_06190 [Paenibacillus albicereus]|uniref:Uncharacterized protein n=1 Tax=Paenibacillus albicereus TaxID=2726185 RepID=A0A6H2GUX4_9BACL|nr:hypothetical protein [Paenibacillus albicereus]QJC51192.1 hypothetical protein HGI30_06190 [Paenibacillus albicereus]